MAREDLPRLVFLYECRCKRNGNLVEAFTEVTWTDHEGLHYLPIKISVPINNYRTIHHRDIILVKH